jgi:ABC-type amino acid transport substrate-binding protein
MASESPESSSTASNQPPPTVKLDTSHQAETLPPTEQTDAPKSLPAIPGYELHIEIGRGAMGIVFKAIQVDLKRVVALKMLLSGSQAGKSEVQRFRIEAEAAARLDHAAIVPIYEVGEHEGHHFFSMKLVEGGSLSTQLADYRALPPGADPAATAERQTKIARFLAKVADAIHCAHQAGILHRDLKPGNILIDTRGEPHVADFGLAKRVEGDSVLTQTGVIVGTPSYMSPEQATGKKNLTPAADIYSLGSILYEMLTGKPPFKADTIMETLVQVMEHEPVRPRSLNSAVSRDLETICLKALAKDPARRYASAAEMAEELRRFAAGEPIKTRPAGWIERTVQRCRRNPVVTALTGAVLVLTLIMTAMLIVRLWPASSDGSLDRVRAAGKLVIAIDDNYPPMEFRQGDELVGFDIDVAEEIARRLGVKADIQHRHWNWPDVPAGLNKRECDMAISSWSITAERKKEVAFVQYTQAVQVYLCRRGVNVASEQDLAGKRVVVGADSVAHTYLLSVQAKKIALKQLILLDPGGDPFPLLKKGEADVTIIDNPVGRYKARLDPDFIVTGSVGHDMNPDPIGMVFRPEDVQLQQAVAQAVGGMKADGSFDRILDKWFKK